MALAAGETLGPYQVITQIGVGGMGEVYRARDSRLDRAVAIKVSTEQFSDRFEREARAVAALNHPNICTLYDVGPNYLVMEYVEGESPRGPLPLDEALRIARQIADALDEAHTKGIIHRDLKPGNIKITPDGAVKVLDFGLAKIGGTPTVSSLDSPTISLAATQAGVILGTAAYMSPEQARGKAVDARTDIWAFGVVLYELLTGEQLFQGEDLTDTLAAVVRKDPDWQRVPFEVRRLLRACLEKEPKRRLRSIGDAWKLIDEAPAVSPRATPSRSRWNVALAAAAAAFALAAIGLAFVHFGEAPVETRVVRFEIPAPENTVLADIPPAISPDNRNIAFVAHGADGQDRIWIRSIDTLEARMLPGTEGVRVPGPFWSPDSRSVAFASGAVGALKRIDVTGGPSVTLGVVESFGGGTWSRNGVILIGSPRGVLRMSQAGGAAELVTKTDAPSETAHFSPQFLPDGDHFLYAAGRSIYITSLNGASKTRLSDAASRAQYVPPAVRGETGHVIFVRDGTLLAQPLDPDSFQATGDALPVADHVGGAFGGAAAFFSASPSGGLVYRSGTGTGGFQLTWFDRSGTLLGTLGPTGAYGDVAISRGGSQVAVAFRDTQSFAQDVYVMDAKQGVLARFTSAPGVDDVPVWSPDDKRLAFASDRGNTYGATDGFVQDVSAVGKPEQILKDGRIRDWSADGRYLLYDDRDENRRFRIGVLPLEGDRKPILYPHDRFEEAQGQFAPPSEGAPPGSPRWIAYTSNESNENEVYVQSFPPGQKFRISNGGGIEPRWRRDGRELFYISRQTETLMAVDVKLAPDFQSGPPRQLFKTRIATGGARAYSFHYDVAPDGKRFLMIARPEQSANAASPITVVLNWQAALRR